MPDAPLDFNPFESLDHFAAWLGEELDDVIQLARLADTKRYTHFRVRKRNGGFRQISAPTIALKCRQQRIAIYLERIRPKCEVATGYVPGRSIFDHAAPHVGKDWVLTIDLVDFFGSIKQAAITEVLTRSPVHASPDVADLVGMLACFRGHLPQGSPLSPTISNYYCRDLDADLTRLAVDNRLEITRYADDICLSGFGEPPVAIVTGIGKGASAGPALVHLLRRYGFNINDRKTHLVVGRRRKMVTGLMVGDSISMPSKWRRQLRTLEHLLSKYGPEEAERIVSTWDKRTLRRGRMGSITSTVEGKRAFLTWLSSKRADLPPP